MNTSDFLLLQLLVAGAFLIALASYLVKKDFAFHQERCDFVEGIKAQNAELQAMIGENQRTIIAIIQSATIAETELRSAVKDLTNNVIRLEMTLREYKREGGA